MEEFEVVLHATFDETVDGDGFVDVVVYEGLLKDFEVLDVFVFIFRVELQELDSALTQRAYTLTLLSGTSTRYVVSIEHRFGAGCTVYAVDDLAECSAVTTLLDLG